MVMIWAAMLANGVVVWCFMDAYYGGSRTNTAGAYCQFLNNFMPSMFESGYIYMYINSPIHTAKKVRVFLEELSIEMLDHPPYFQI